MQTSNQRSAAAHSAVLAFGGYANLQDENMDTKIRELIIGIKQLCDETGYEFDEAVEAAVASTSRKTTQPV